MALIEGQVAQFTIPDMLKNSTWLSAFLTLRGMPGPGLI